MVSGTPVGGHVSGDPSRLVREGSLRIRAAVFIDGGYLRVLVRQAGYQFNPDYIEKVAHACVAGDEVLLRALYYDCAPYNGTLRLPVSGRSTEFSGSGEWLAALAAKPQVAVRLGTLKFRGFEPKKVPIDPQELTDDDFSPRFVQKGVDMRLGLDVASYAATRSVDRIILLTGDTDCLPAMKLARTAGLQVVMIKLPKQHIGQELLWHSDFQRNVAWPEQ